MKGLLLYEGSALLIFLALVTFSPLSPLLHVYILYTSIFHFKKSALFFYQLFSLFIPHFLVSCFFYPGSFILSLL